MCAFAEDWDPRSALGAPLGPIGFARERVFSETFVFTTFSNGSLETVSFCFCFRVELLRLFVDFTCFYKVS